MMKFELISFKICPFVQRAVITLLHKKIPYKVTYIDLSSPPDWFRQISPFGKVPVLKVDDQHVIFESAIIDEFLDETSPGTLLPSDPVRRGIDRSWIEFGSTLTLDFSGLIHSQDAEMFDSKLQLVKKEIKWLENQLDDGAYFNGNDFSLVDIAYAPLFMRINILGLGETLCPFEELPRVTAWSSRLLELPELPQSVVSDFEALFKSHLINKAPYTAGRLGLK